MYLFEVEPFSKMFYSLKQNKRKPNKSPQLFDKTIVCLSGSFAGMEENQSQNTVARQVHLNLVSYSVTCKLVSISAVQSSFLCESQIGKYLRQEWGRSHGFPFLEIPCWSINWNDNCFSVN